MIHINRFIDKIKMAESRKMKDFPMTTNEAKDLHGDITKLLLVLLELQSKMKPVAPEDNKVEIDGGKW